MSNVRFANLEVSEQDLLNMIEENAQNAGGRGIQPQVPQPQHREDVEEKEDEPVVKEPESGSENRQSVQHQSSSGSREW